MKKRNIVIVIVLVLIVALSGLVRCYQLIERFADEPLHLTQDTIFTLPAGTGRTGLEKLLVNEKLINSDSWFAWLLRTEPSLAEFKAGTYRFTPGMTVRRMLLLLVSGKEAQFSVRFPEGAHLNEWLSVLSQAPYLKHTFAGKDAKQLAAELHVSNLNDLEGWLYPDTYAYTADTTDISLIKRAHQRMVRTVDDIWQQRAPSLPYKTPQDLVTMASIIEKETGLAAERPEVASVFVNRMRIGMRLQTDPTVIYGLGDKYKGVITRKDLDTPTPYNTYFISGLPPTAIAMPSLESLKAAAHPAHSAYLYFVADGKGGHTFSTNLASHNKAVNEYRKYLKDKNE